MKLKDLLPRVSMLCEMAKIDKQMSGLSRDLWIGPVGGQHSPFRIKVSNTTNGFDKNNNFSISISNNPQIIRGHKSLISSDELEDIFDWIKTNSDKLQLAQKAVEKGELFITYNNKKYNYEDFLHQLLQKI